MPRFPLVPLVLTIATALDSIAMPRRTRPISRSVAVAILTALAFLAGCRKHVPTAGDPCTGDDAVCPDKQQKLTCIDGKLAATKCRGALGCLTNQAGSVLCDISGNVEGDACTRNDEDQDRCTSDGTSKLACMDGHFVTFPCTGGCGSGSGVVTCKVVPAVGVPCPGLKGLRKCVPDGKAIMACDGRWKIERECTAPCDEMPLQNGNAYPYCRPMAPGNPCDELSRFKGKRIVTCSADDRDLLECVDGLWAVNTKCSGGCDHLVCKPAPGDPCLTPDDTTCFQRDAVLQCRGGRWVPDRKCLGGGGCRNPGMCDVSVGREGELCGRDWAGTKACDEQRHDVLVCRATHWKKEKSCGELGCRVHDATADCAQ